MKKRLGISSDEFLEKYTIVPFNKKQRLPLVILKMGGDENKRCPFVSPKGCAVYEDRPWACRMYPLGLASPKEDNPAREEKFYFVMEEAHCRGFGEQKEWTVRKWLEDQGIAEYNRMGESFKEITLHDYLQKGGDFGPEKMEMFYMGCYNVDKFRRFVFESRFLQYFEIDPEMVERIRTDDLELMKFAVQWLKLALFNEPTVKVRKQLLQTKIQELKKKEQAL
jgi:hypothetical protein